MPLESDADRRALLEIDGIAVRTYPGGVPVDRRAQYDGPSEETQVIDGQLEVVQVAPSLLMISADLAGLVHRDRVEVLEGQGLGDYRVVRISREDDGAFARVTLGARE